MNKEAIKKINKIFDSLIQELKIVLQNDTKSNDSKKVCRKLMYKRKSTKKGMKRVNRKGGYRFPSEK